MITPLFMKYGTESGCQYVYDVATGEILSADEDSYRIIDYIGIVPESRLPAMLPDLSPSGMQMALDRIAAIRKEGCLPDHPPTIAHEISGFLYDEKLYTPDEFLSGFRRQLVLDLTQECNMQCEYCIYGDHYPNYRTYTPKTMQRETALRAIGQFLEQSEQEPYICFYGGEPLLAYGLLRECIRFGRQRAKETGRNVKWSMTTNGTLLSDATTDFLCENEVTVYISFDGAKKIHDRYRLLRQKDAEGRPIGSFDVVMANIRSFVARHPDYRNRGLVVTVAPPYDFDSYSILDELLPYFPILRITPVSTSNDQTFLQKVYGGCQSGLHLQGGCRQSPQTACSPQGGPFDDTIVASMERDAKSMRDLMQRWKTAVIEHGFANVQKMPEHRIAWFLHGTALTGIHGRAVAEREPRFYFNCRCIPGHARLYCRADGAYFPCERVNHVDALKLGDVSTGVVPAKVMEIMESARLIADCGNCVARQTCEICMAFWPVTPGGEIDYEQLGVLCEQTRRMTRAYFRLYTEIMEKNPNAFDGTESALPGLKKVYLVPKDYRRSRLPGFSAGTVCDRTP